MTTSTKKTPPRRPPTPEESGRRGGLARSPKKAKSSRENGKRGGRPRKSATASIPPTLLAELVLDLRGENRAFARASTGLAEYYLANYGGAP